MLLVGGGAVTLVLAQLLDWATVDSDRGSGGLNNAFDYPTTGGLAWALTVAAGLLAFLLAGGLINRGRLPWDALLLGATGIATILMLLRVILGAGEIVRPGITYDLQRGPGMWVGLLAAAMAFGGAFLNYRSVEQHARLGTTERAAPRPSAHPPRSG